MRLCVLLLLVLLAGCGGGSGGESGAANTVSSATFILSKAAIELKTHKRFFNYDSPALDKLVITTKETSLTVGMPVGQQKPDWLNFTLVRQTDGSYHLAVDGYNHIATMKSDIYKSTIRVGTVHNDGSFAKYIDIPVTFDLIDFVEFSPGNNQKLNSRTGALHTSTVDYVVRTTAKDWQLTTDVSWLSTGVITPDVYFSKFKVLASAQNLQQGTHTANLIFKSTDGRTTVKQPISFQVEKPRWWLARYTLGLSQLGGNKHLEAAIPVSAHDSKLIQSLQSSTDAGWLQTQLIDNKLQLKANTAGLPSGMHYAQVKISDPKNSVDDKTVWVGLFISDTATAVTNIDLKIPSGIRTISTYLADPLRPYVYVHLSQPEPQLRAYHLITGELLWQLELGDFRLQEISSDGQHLLLTKSIRNDCAIAKLPLSTPPATDWINLAKEYLITGCVSKIHQIDGTMVNHDSRSLNLADPTTLRIHAKSLTRLDERDSSSDLLNVALHSVKQVMLSPLNDLSVVVTNIGGMNWKSRVTLFSTMVLPDQKQVRFFELAHLDNVEINESFYAPVTNRLWTGRSFVDLQDGKMALTSFAQHCPGCQMYDNHGVESRDGRVAILGQTYSTEVNDTAKRLMIFDRHGQIQSGSATNSNWQYGWNIGINGIQLSADEQWLIVGSGDLIEIKRF